MLGRFGVGAGSISPVQSQVVGQGTGVNGGVAAGPVSGHVKTGSTSKLAEALKARTSANAVRPEGSAYTPYVPARSSWTQSKAGADAAVVEAGTSANGGAPYPPQVSVPSDYPGFESFASAPARKAVPMAPAASTAAAAEGLSGNNLVNGLVNAYANDRGSSSPPYITTAEFNAIATVPGVREGCYARYFAHNAAQAPEPLLNVGDVSGSRSQADGVVSAFSDSSDDEGDAAVAKLIKVRRAFKFTEHLFNDTPPATPGTFPRPTTEIQIGAPYNVSRAMSKARPIQLVSLAQAEANKACYGQSCVALENAVSQQGATGQITMENRMAAGIDALTISEAHEEQAKKAGQAPSQAAGAGLRRAATIATTAKKAATQVSDPAATPAAPIASVAQAREAAPLGRQVIGRASQLTVFGDFIAAGTADEGSNEGNPTTAQKEAEARVWFAGPKAYAQAKAKTPDLNKALPPCPNSSVSTVVISSPQPRRASAVQGFLNTFDGQGQHARSDTGIEGADETGSQSPEIMIDTFVHEGYTTWLASQRMV